MQNRIAAGLIALGLLLGLAGYAPVTHAARCSGRGIELQVLGSGGPETQDQRASSSYLIWRDGKARVLVDSGGGSALRFGQSGANMTDLDLVLFTHLHVDHSADFPALIKSSFFEDRDRALPVLGPPGNTQFPAVTEFINALFDPQRGAFRYLSDFLPNGQGSYTIKPQTITLQMDQTQKVYSTDTIAIWATPVVHGTVPALAWRVELGGVRIAFSGDTDGDHGQLATLARHADLFVAHNAVPEHVTGVARRLHMPPSVIGRIAAAAEVKQLVLSHRMLRTLGRETETLAAVAGHYHGPVEFADDLSCYSLEPAR